jgi:hypothetical protein
VDLKRGRPSSRVPYFRLWPRKWNGGKTFIRIIHLYEDPDLNWFMTHYDKERGGTLGCCNGECRYCERGIQADAKFYCPALLYIWEAPKGWAPGPLICLELQPTMGRELEAIYDTFGAGVLVIMSKDGNGTKIAPSPDQANLPPLPRAFDVESALCRVWKMTPLQMNARRKTA